MTTLSAEAKRQRLLRKFFHSGNEGQWTRAFEKFPLDVRATLLDLAAVGEQELPVLSFFRDTSHWVLLTTEQVITWRSERVLRLPWAQIEEATVDVSLLGRAVSSHPKGKLGLDRLQLILRDGERVELELEAGKAFFGFWNVLRMVTALRKN